MRLFVGAKIALPTGPPFLHPFPLFTCRSANATEQPAEISGVEGVTFPSLPDCPRCATPTVEDELKQFGMCSQCKVNAMFSRGSFWKRLLLLLHEIRDGGRLARGCRSVLL